MAPSDDRVVVNIDGKDISLLKSLNLYQALKEVGIYVPNVVWHEDMPKYCDDMLCMVEVEGNARLVPAMKVAVTDGLKVKTGSPLIDRMRQAQITKLLSSHYGDCYAPCQLQCPADVDAMRYIQLSKEKRWDEACLMLYETNPFPLTCGYVCPATCQLKCRRGAVDSPVAIRNIKRFLAEKFIDYPHEFFVKHFAPCEEGLKTGKKIAIVGGGPCGVSTAFYARRMGHDVTVFEGLPEAGGMLRYGIPEFRYPKDMLKKELDIIFSTGVKLQCNKRLGKDFTIESLKKEGFDKVVVATGASLAANLPTPGVRDVKKGVYNGVDFLREVMMTKPYGKSFQDSKELGDFCLVVGGGSVSMDVARAAIRCGAKRVVVSCILAPKDMPCHPEEMDQFKEEGGEIWTLTGPKRFLVDDKGTLAGVEYHKFTHFDNFTGEGIIKGSEYMLHPDSVIVAIGQRVDTEPLKEIGVNEVGRAKNNYAKGDFTAGCNVYAGGDCVFELPMTAVQCVNHGRRIAWQLHHELVECCKKEECCKDGCCKTECCEKCTPFPEIVQGYVHTRGNVKETSEALYANIEKAPLQCQAELDPEVRKTNWESVEKTLTEEQVELECARCLRCGCMDPGKCELKEAATFLKVEQPPSAQIPRAITIDDTNKFFNRDLGKCIACMRCVRVCRDVRNIGATFAQDTDDRTVTYIKNVDTRLQSKKGAVKIGNACESCSACVAVCPTNALYLNKMENPQPLMAGDVPPVRTTCPYCGVGCGIELHIKNGKIVKVTGEKDHPVSKGQLCVKGKFGWDYAGSKLRLTHPLIRKDGAFVNASWEEAMTLIAKKFGELKEKYGGDALGGFSSAKCSNEDNYIFQKFIRCCFGTNNVDHCARLCHASTVAGLAQAFGSGVMTNDINGLEGSDVIIITGSNTSESHPIAALKVKDAVVKHGAKVIVVDPRSIDLTRFAEIHAPQRPGTDVIVFNAIMHEILKNDWHNKKFINERTEGFEEFKKVIMECPPELAEKISGVPATQLREIAKIYSHAKNGSIIFCMGITQHTTGVDNVLTLANLALLCGHIGRPSTGVNPLRGQNNVQGACDMGALCNVYSGYQKVHLPEVNEKFQKLWGVKLNDKIGLPITKMVNAAFDGKVKGLYQMGENPAVTDPNCDHAVEALKKLEFMVVQDIFFTPTAQLADVVLPARSLAEKEPCVQTSTERRVQMIRPGPDAPGEAREDWKIIRDVAQKMGYKMPMYQSAKEIQDEIANVTPAYAGIVHERLQEHGLHWPCPNKEHPGTPVMYTQKFNHPSGLAKFKPVPYKAPNEEPCEDFPLVMSTGRMIYHFHSGTMSRKTDLLEKYAGTYVEMAEEDAQKLGIKSGDMVLIETRRGQLVIPALTPSRIAAKGTVWLPFHFEEAPANRLTNDAIDPVASIPEFKVCACRVRPLEPHEQGLASRIWHPVVGKCCCGKTCECE